MVEGKTASSADGRAEAAGPKDGSTSNPLSRKINKILETRIENDKAAVEALKELSLFFPENSLKARRNLRGQIERRSVTINQEFVAALKEVKDAVDAIYDDVKTINSQCSEMKAKLQAAKAETKHLTEQTTKLQKQRSVLEMQQEVAKAFTNAFLMTPEEVALLRATNPTIGPAFFAALDKTQTIKNNTKHLLQTGEQTTALEVLSYSSEVREAGVSGLYHWLLNQARHTDSLSAALPTAMAYLEDRPQLFRLVVEEWVVLRRGALSRNFLHSLTHLSPTHSPIELGAHSPTRYVGDMLAWLHQALAGEREVMGALFGGCKSLDISAETSSSLASIAEAVCRPLKTRIEQMVVSGEPSRPRGPSGRRATDAAPAVSRKPVMLYKMRGLLQFYSSTIEQLTGAGVLVCALEELQQLCHKMFLAALHTQVEEGCEHLPAPPPSLTPSPTVTSLLSLLSDVITAATLTTHHQRDHAAEVVELVIDPLLSSLSNNTNNSSGGGGGDAGVVEANVYLLNCCHLLHSTVSLLQTSNTPDKLQQIQEVADGAVSKLCEQQTTAVMHSISLLPMVAHINAATANGGLVGDSPLATLPYTSPSAVQNFLAKLDHFLASPDAYQLPPLRLLVSSQHRQQVTQQCNTALLQHYTALHNLVHTVAAAGYPAPQKLMPKTPDMIRALAGL